MLHFNGGSASQEAYFSTTPHDYLDIPEAKGSFALAKYFIHMPWTWARFQALAMITGKTADGQRPKGFALKLNHKKTKQNTHIEMGTHLNISETKRPHRRHRHL